MTRLTRSARGLLVAIAALALTGTVVLAARSLPSASATGTQHAGAVSGKTIPVSQAGGALASNENSDAHETPEPQETPDAEDKAHSESNDDAANADRPHNHGWFVSQAAQADTPAGFNNHGAYVSSVAHGDLGKPDAPATGADKSAAGKTKGAEAKGAHQD